MRWISIIISLVAWAFVATSACVFAQTPTAILLPATPGPCDDPIFTRVNISAPAPAGGVILQLSSSVPSVASVPASVTVPQGATQANFNVTCVVQSQAIAVTLTATTGGGTQSAVLNILAPALLSVSTKPPNTEPGYSNSIKFSGPAPAGGVIVTLSSSHPNLYPVPASLTVPAGSSGQSFVVTAIGAVSLPTTVTLTATGLGVVKTGTALLMPATPTAINFQMGGNFNAPSATVAGGDSKPASVTVSGPAGSGGLVVQLTSSRTSAATVPASVTIPPGQTSAGFTVTTTPSSAPLTPVTLTATVGTVSKAVSITVTGTALDILGLDKRTVVGGQTNEGRLLSNNPTATGGMVVQLASSNTAVVLVPPTVTIPAGANFAAFNIATLPVEAIRTVTITATSGGVTRTEQLSLVPEGPTEITITQNKTLGGNTISGKLKALATDDQFTVQLATSDTDIATVPASVQFAPGETIKTFAIVTKPVATAKNVIISAKTTNTRTKGAALAFTISTTFAKGNVTVTLTDGFTVDPPKITAFTFSTASVTGGSNTSVTGTVTLDGKAPASFPINVSSDNTTAIHASSAVTFPAGSNIGTFQLSTGQVPVDVSVSLSVSNGGSGKSASITVRR